MPDDSTWNRLAKSDVGTRARFFESPTQRVVVPLVSVLVKNELIRCSITTEIGKRVSDLTVHRNKPVLISLSLNNYQPVRWYLRASATYGIEHWTRTEIEMSNFQLQQFNYLGTTTSAYYP